MTRVWYGFNSGVKLLVSDGLGTDFNGYLDGILFLIDQVIELDFSDISFEGYIDGNPDGLVTVFQYDINVVISWCVASWLVTGFDGDVDWINFALVN